MQNTLQRWTEFYQIKVGKMERGYLGHTNARYVPVFLNQEVSLFEEQARNESSKRLQLE